MRQVVAASVMDSALVKFTVANPRRVDSRSVFALVDVEVEAGGIGFTICGVQARREHDGQTSVRLPTFKDSEGVWRSAVILPTEAKAPLANAVLIFLVEEGLAQPRF